MASVLLIAVHSYVKITLYVVHIIMESMYGAG
jgi:hypothetical protein